MSSLSLSVVVLVVAYFLCLLVAHLFVAVLIPGANAPLIAFILWLRPLYKLSKMVLTGQKLRKWSDPIPRPDDSDGDHDGR